ncbi:intraflagellar transport protein 27 homolog [Lytechinus variegatus]|uniref:intraflagellar transport protein 27 homolog n=1 Tax=Lytechinus variegatus TaxID=7654 RepID=UPI001BB15781|nr:intraflagellar transport protein 27 homolog [Lytechinus variegatus]
MPVSLRAKCLVVGDSAVGKSALTQVFHSDGAHFPKGYSMTVGVELCVKNISIPDTSDTVELYIYDTAGKEMFFDYAQQAWEHPSVMMVVMDVTNETSFTACNRWVERVKAKAGQHIPGVFVANKIDLEGRRVVERNKAEEFAKGKGLEYFECSAKDQENTDAPFYYLANAFYKLYQERVEVMKTIAT